MTASDVHPSSSSSPFVGPVAPIVESDDELRRILDEAALPPLLPALAYATGDLTLLREHLRPDPLLMSLPQAGLTDEQQAEVRALALDALARFRDGGCRPAPPPPDADVLRIMEFAVGGSGMADYLPLVEEELAHRGEDRRAPGWRLDEVAPERAAAGDLRVVVIGAGMSGLLAAHRLQQAGVPFVVLEKNDDVGGTWYENTYPGCRVDNPNHNYSYSFAQRHDWPAHFSTQEALRGYFDACADAFGLRPHIRFGVEVTSATWSDADRRWTVRLASGEELVADAVVSAVGQLNRPMLPDIPGVGTFAGPAFHTARWRDDVDLRGKRVAVIGTGASAVQAIPEIAPLVDELVVFQRTPPWLAPTPDYHDAVEPGLRWLYDRLPSYSEWHRFFIFWAMGDGVLENVRVDDTWDGGGASVSPANEMVRQMLLMYLGAELGDRPDLLAACTPGYPPGAKRMLRDNGVWAGALKRDNVRLVTDPIREITPTAVVTTGAGGADGAGVPVAHDVDVVVYGTGFHASEFLTPMTVRGRGGVDLHERWGGEARAYLGVTVPGFPNLFCLYGPNTNIVINGSIVYFSECGVRYILECLRLVLETGNAALDVRPEVHDRFNEQVDAEHARMAWGASDVNSWYKNASGRVSQNWPFTLLSYWQRTLRPDPDDYELIPNPEETP
jgi:4-hydroxyacetophenone monooxygenase